MAKKCKNTADFAKSTAKTQHQNTMYFYCNTYMIR